MTLAVTPPRLRMLRDTTSSAQVEALVIVAVTTVLVTRLYLHLTGYPQVGGAVLHIAHVLWGGLLMVVALMISLTFLGRAPHRASVLIGGIGFGLFLDEVGKFVTKTNDYFFRPAVAIMYVVVVLLLVANRAVHSRRGLSGEEYLANSAATAIDGLSRGLSPTARDQALAQLKCARDLGVDSAVVGNIEELVNRCFETGPGRSILTSVIVPRLPDRLRGGRGTWIAAVLLTVFSLGILVNGFATLDQDLAEDRGDFATVLQLVSTAVVVLLCAAGMLGMRRARRWSVRALRAAALITVFFVDVLDFAIQEFGALINVAVGVAALSVFSYHLRQESRREALPDTV